MSLRSIANNGLPVRLATILTAGLALRFAALSQQSLWLDEVASWSFASGSLARALHAEPTNPPLYYVLLHLWIGLFGSSEAGLRSLSVVAGIVSVWLVYQLVSGVLSKEIAFLASGYQAVSTFQIFYAQEARAFALLVTLLLLSSLCLWNALTSQSGRRRTLSYTGYAIFTALAFYTHFISVFFVAAQGTFVLFRRPKQLLAAGISALAALISFSPWLITMVRAARHGGQMRRYLLLKLPRTYFSFLFGDTLIPMDERAVRNIHEVFRENWLILAVAFVSTAILTAYCWRAWKRWGDRILYLVVMGVVPVLMAFVVSFKLMIFSERYLIPAAPFVYAIIAAAIYEIYSETKDRKTHPGRIYAGHGAIAAYAALLVISLANYYFNPRYGKEEWREVAAYIEGSGSVSSHNALVIFDPSYLEMCYRYYQRLNLPSWRLTAQEATTPASSAEIQNHVRGYQRVWLVRSHYDSDDVLNAVRWSLHQRSFREFPKDKGIEVFSFDMGQPDPTIVNLLQQQRRGNASR